ncbi:TPA: hypothetical protein NHT77_003299 [Raoultella ornithinolytica]|nr:hypothetical protein [Raoultella ornithinolytica]
MTEGLSSLLDAIKSRLISPFFGNFILSWLAVNWKVVIFALFTKNNDSSIIIEKLSGTIGWVDFLIAPAIIALILCLVIPSINLTIEFLTSKISKTSKMIKLSQEEKIRLKASEIEDRIQKKLSKSLELKGRISSMMALENELQNQIAVLQENKSNLSLDLSTKRSKVSELNDYLENNDASFIRLNQLTQAIVRKNETIYNILDSIREAKIGIREFKIFENNVQNNIKDTPLENSSLYKMDYQEKLNKLEQIDTQALEVECKNAY